MKYIVLVVLFLSSFGCKNSFTITEIEGVERTVGFSDSSFKLESKTQWFDKDLADSYRRDSYVQNVGEKILKDVLVGYENQLPKLRFSNNGEENIQFVLRSVTVKRGIFTFNLTHPGPLYKVIMKVDIIEGGTVVDFVELKTLANMSDINFKDENTKWMSNEEKANQEYQKETFRVAIRKLYQELYFNYFKISLTK